MQIADKYSPQEIEQKWYDYWIDNRLFHSEPDGREPYTIVIPPPNVTGMLHMGHMLNNTLQDVLIRRARMSGKNACWVPGMDHASIATEAKVVAMLHEKGIEKSSLSREEFLEYAWEWKEKYGGMILKQLRKLGASCDWDRTCFTMDEARTESVLRVFCDLYEKGKIYRGVRMVNWDPAAQTALSDEEVVFKESHGKLYYLRYRVEGTDRTIIVATTRPETILGDTALCVNPDDERYAWLPEDARVIVPLVGRSVPVIRDTYVDIAFGTGALKVTPAHDVNDYMLGEKYGLESIDIFNDDGTINDKVGLYAGMERFALGIARLHAVENLSLESEAGIVGGMCGVHFPDIGRLPVDRGHRLRLLAHRRLVHRFENLFAQFFIFDFGERFFLLGLQDVCFVDVCCDVRQFQRREPRSHERRGEKRRPKVFTRKILPPLFVLSGQKGRQDASGDLFQPFIDRAVP